MSFINKYDVGIVGGGLAGLSSAILLADKGYKVILFEKNSYPFHKVCGEYISNESLDFMQRLGLPIKDWNLPQISNFSITHHLGAALTVALPLGGIGVSRYFLDNELSDLALQKGVVILQGCKVEEITFNEKDDYHIVKTRDGEFDCSTVIGAYGKRSNLDKKLSRPFIENAHKNEQNFVGVKYHVRADLPADAIELHLFDGGYAGISKVEDDKYCFCYLTTAQKLKEVGGDIERLEQEVMSKNARLAHHLASFEKINTTPVTISQIEFGPKEQVNQHLLMAGDSAGMITPLTGNGMSMAMHAANMAYEAIDGFLKKEYDRTAMQSKYEKTWQQSFSSRVKMARRYQHLFFSGSRVNTAISILKRLPFLTKTIIRSTHGKSF